CSSPQWLSPIKPANRPATSTSTTVQRTTQRPTAPRSHQGSQETVVGRGLATGGSPDRQRQVQLDAELVVDTGADQIDHLEYITGGSAGIGHDVVGVAVVHLGAAYTRADQAGLLDQRDGAQPRRIAE